MIIISRCPYRISLLGGGSDLDWFVKENNFGICLGYSLSKYTYIVVNQLPPQSKRGTLNYSSREEYSNLNEIAHPLIRSALEELNIKQLLEISSFGFASRGSGLGGSSSFLVAILKCLSKIKKNGKLFHHFKIQSFTSNYQRIQKMFIRPCSSASFCDGSKDIIIILFVILNGTPRNRQTNIDF